MKRLFFVLLLTFTFLSLFVEVYTFKYFLIKHFFISTDVLIGLSLIFYYFILNQDGKEDRKYENVYKLITFVAKYSFIPLIFIYLLFSYLNVDRYPNYVFSTYHLQPDLLIRPIVFSVLLFAFGYVKNKAGVFKNSLAFLKSKKHRFSKVALICVVLLLTSFTLVNILRDQAVLMPYALWTVKNLNSPYENRYDYMMNIKYGYFYQYIKFIKSVVPENSSILLPPQKNPWQYEGNQRLSRFFLYPRTLYSAHEQKLPKDIEYIEIAWGSQDFKPDSDNEYGWPKEKIKASKVYIYDFKSQKYTVYEKDYDPKEFLKPGVYGIIKTK